MGFGNFGPGGCCSCDSQPPICGEYPCLPPGYGAGVCAWCGDNTGYLVSPYPPSAYCPFELIDGFETQKRLPYVPWWTWQQNFFHDPAANHLFNGGYCCSTLNRYYRGFFYGTGTPFPRREFVTDGGKTNVNFFELKNIQPVHGWPLYNYNYVKRPENGLVIQSPTTQTDILPIRTSLRSKFKIPKAHRANWVAVTNRNNSPSVGVPIAIVRASIAGSEYRVPFRDPVFQWFDNQLVGSLFVEFKLEHTLRVDVPAFVGLYEPIEHLWPENLTVRLNYNIGECSTSQNCSFDKTKTIGFAQLTFETRWDDEKTLEIEAIHKADPADNRRMFTTANFYIDDLRVHTNTVNGFRPGYVQSGTPTTQQSMYQRFCGSQMNGRLDQIANEACFPSCSSPSAALWTVDRNPRMWVIDDYRMVATRPKP